MKAAHINEHCFEDFLENVGNVGVLQPALSTPVQHQGSIEVDESFPSRRLVSLHPSQQTARRRGGRGLPFVAARDIANGVHNSARTLGGKAQLFQVYLSAG